MCQSSGYRCLEGDDRKRAVNSLVQETDLAYDSRYYLTVPLLKYAIGTSRRYDRSLDWEESGAGSEDDVARIREDDNAVTMAPGIRNGEDDARAEYDGAHDREDPSAQKEPRGTRKKTDYAVRRRAHAVEVKRLPDGPVTPYESQAEAARSEGWSKSTLSDWLCGRHTKCTIPVGYAIRRSTSDDWIRHDSVDTAPSSGATTSRGVTTLGGATISGGASSTPNEDGFLKEGPYMNCRLRIQRPRYAAYGTVVKYLPGSENDGIELWKVRHDDGDEEDVELHELMQWICKRPKEGV